MKNLFFLVLSITLISCSTKTEVLEIPLTSSSSEAIKILSDELFFKTNKITGRLINRGQSPQIYNAIIKSLQIDPNFIFAKVMLTESSNSMSRAERISVLDEAYKKRNSISDIERGIIEAIYFYRVNGDKVKASQILDKLVADNPNYYYLKVFNGNYQNSRGKAPCWKNA